MGTLINWQFTPHMMHAAVVNHFGPKSSPAEGGAATQARSLINDRRGGGGPCQRRHFAELKTVLPPRGVANLQNNTWPTSIGPRTAEYHPFPPSIENESWILSAVPMRAVPSLSIYELSSAGPGVVMFETQPPATVVCCTVIACYVSQSWAVGRRASWAECVQGFRG